MGASEKGAKSPETDRLPSSERGCVRRDMGVPSPAPAPEPPYNVFTPGQRRLVVLMAALAGFFSPFSAFIYFPAIDYVSADLGVTVQLVNVTITVYLIVQGVIPAFFGDLADQVGRRPVYLLVLSVYLVSCISLALQRSYPALLVLRMLQSAGSSGGPLRCVKALQGPILIHI